MYRHVLAVSLLQQEGRLLVFACILHNHDYDRVQNAGRSTYQIMEKYKKIRTVRKMVDVYCNI